MPIIMKLFAHQRFFRGGTTPKVVINGSWDGLRTFHFSDAGPSLVAKAAGAQDFADVSIPHPLNGFGNTRAGSGLGAGLDNAIVFARRGYDLTAFPDIMRHRFFEVNILASLNCPDGPEGVPMVGRGEGNDIDIFIFEQLANIGISFDLPTLVLPSLQLFIEDVAVHVAQRHQPRTFDLGHLVQMVFAASIEADDSVADIRICSFD